MPQKYSLEIKRLLRDYVELRLQKVTVENYRTLIDRSEDIHDPLWSQVRSAAIADPNTNSQLAVESINNVIDIHAKRAMTDLQRQILDKD